jgi:hypothetical protein
MRLQAALLPLWRPLRGLRPLTLLCMQTQVFVAPALGQLMASVTVVTNTQCLFRSTTPS